MTIPYFDKSLLIEQIRYLENSHPLTCHNEEEISASASDQNFHERLWQRAQCLINQHDLSTTITHAARLSRTIKIITLLLVALLGAMGTVYAITDSNAINIYWLLLVLLGFNFISMLLWLIGISLNMDGLTSGLLTRLSVWITAINNHKAKNSNQKNGKPAFRAWLNCSYTGSVGKWQLSKMTHQLWIAYLLSGLTFLVLLLMVKQYDFVWGTTLLSDSVFIKLTDMLGHPLRFTGFTTPSADQVQQSRLGPDLVLSAELRSAWAQFLLGSLLCFGILPRLLLLLWSILMSSRVRRQFKPDFYLPYYINLRQRLMPMASHGQIVDADTSPPLSADTAPHSPVSHSLPEDTKWVAVELGENFDWPIDSVRPQDNLGQVIDRDSLTTILQLLQSEGDSVLAVAVAATRSPDRGVQRTISNLLSNCSQRWLVLLLLPDEPTASSKRLSAWYRLAEACDIPADHVISLSVV